MKLVVEGATHDQLELGLSAARSVFASAGFSPEEAARAAWDVEAWDDIYDCKASKRPSERTFQGYRVWWDAQAAAKAACCAGWPAVPPGSGFSLDQSHVAVAQLAAH